jgi:hypothetical protein
MLKLLDYGKPNPFMGAIGGQRNLAWPVNAYRVTLPRSSKGSDDLNPFERVILKLIGVLGVMETRALADETCIPLDLVKSILLRLQDKALIDEHNAIIEQKCDNNESEEKKSPVFVTALLFRELVTGKILPFLHLLDDTNPLQKKEGEDKSFQSIRWEDIHKKISPTQRDVISVLRAMQKRSAAFGWDEKIPAVQQVMIVNQPELHYLDCPIAIQKSDGEFRIADPFGNGFSLILERAFEQLLEQDEKQADWLQQWKHLLHNPRSQRLNAKPKEQFGSDTNSQRYPKLVSSLRLPPNSSFHSIEKIYASIEWALFYACCHRPFESAIARLKLTVQAEHPAMLADAAKNVGLTPHQFGFRPIREGKLLDFQNEKAELETLFSIAILQAQSNESHPLRRIASKYPELINRLFVIKKKRDEKAHGKGRADAQDRELSDTPFMRELVHALLPNIVFSEMPTAELDRDSFADSLLDARASIQGEFTFKTFNRLGTNLQERLIHAERFFLSCKDGDDTLAFVLDLYAALQSAFEMSLTGKLPPDADDVQLIKLAGMRAIAASLCNELPESLRTVKVSAVRETLQGNGQSLGACVIAFLLMSDDDTLCSISDSQSSFISDVTGIISRRGHGNEPLPLPKDDISRLRKSTYSTIKTLLET